VQDCRREDSILCVQCGFKSQGWVIDGLAKAPWKAVIIIIIIIIT
jgi:hypothetical protein